MHDFSSFFKESAESTAVFSFGRHQPMTHGHEKLFDKTVEVAKQHGAKAHIFTSHSHDVKKNPLTSEHKVKLIKHAYPDAHVQASSKEMSSALHIAQHLHSQGHKHLVMVAGSDRVDEFKKRLHHYNGTHEKAKYNFKSIKVVSSGEREEGGISGTQLRKHAAEGNKKQFKAGLLSKLSDKHKEELYHTIRKSLNVHEVAKYFWGEPEGTAHMKRATPGETTRKGSNVMRFNKFRTEQKLPVLLMNKEQKEQLIGPTLQVEQPTVFLEPHKKKVLPTTKVGGSSVHLTKVAREVEESTGVQSESCEQCKRGKCSKHSQNENKALRSFTDFIKEETIEISDSEIQEMVNKLEWEDIADLYSDDELVFEESVEDVIVEKITAQSRIRRRQQFTRMRGKRNVARGIKLHRASSIGVLKKRAVIAARRALYARFLRGRNKSTLSAAEKDRVEQQVKRLKYLQASIATKMLPKIRAIEQKRIAGYRKGRKK